jgi:hypothetical protein
MNLACLRVEGPTAALSSVKTAIPIKPDSSWNAGDKKRRGGVYASSGFSATVADAPHPVALLQSIRAFLEDCTTRGVQFPADISAELDVGISVGDSEQFVASVAFSTEDLHRLATLHIHLSVTAYPTSDEANAGI